MEKRRKDNNYIRFDVEDLDMLKKHARILWILLGALVVCVFLMGELIGLEISVLKIAIFMSCLYAIPIVVLVLAERLVKWGNCYNYLAKLKKRKMRVPERKGLFHCDLAELVTEETRELECENSVAVWEVVISVVPMICFLGWETYLAIEYSAASDVILLAVPVFLFWAFVILQTVRHCSEKKYKDETNPDPARKPRASFFSFLAYVSFFAVASALWMGMVQSVTVLMDHGVEDRDESFLSKINTAAICSLQNLNEDSMETFTIVIENDGYRIEGSDKDLTEAEVNDFMETFMALTDDAVSSLETVNEELDSRAYGTLEKLEITVDVRARSTKLVATPQRKGVEPLVISNGAKN